MLNFLLCLIPRVRNTASCQKNARPIETTQKNLVFCRFGLRCVVCVGLSMPAFRSALDVHSRKGPQGEIRVYRSLRLTVLFNILEFGFITKQNSVTKFLHKFQQIIKCTCEKYRYYKTLPFIFDLFWKGYNTLHVKSCTKNGI